jgi:transposase
VQPRTTPKTPEKQAELIALVTRRRQLIGLQTAERNRQQQARKAAKQSIERVLKLLKKELETLEAAIGKLIENDDDWRQKAELIASTPGIGKPTSHKLVADLPELGQLNRQAISKLVGVAPFNHDSGLKKGRRAIGGGRASVRAALYLPTLTAMRFNPVIKQLAERLTKAGKAFKVVVIACMRKLLTILNQMVKTNSLWTNKLAASS